MEIVEHFRYILRQYFGERIRKNLKRRLILKNKIIK